VARQKGGRAALRAALGFLSEGWALGIFPEGGRRKEGASVEEAPKSGVAMLASRADAPILPVFVDRVPNFLERLRGHRLHVYVGAPISWGGASKERRVRREVAGEVLRAIYRLKDERVGVAD
jgi:1-acyl-sn-glycerol-3-phosphate acyltransferase